MSRAGLRHDRYGGVALEGALVLTLFLLPLLFSILAVGQMLSTQVRLDRALHAALMFAWATPVPTTNAIQIAATAGYGSGTPAMTAVATVACFCMPPTATRQTAGAAVACTSICATGRVLATYVTTSLSTTIDFNLPLPATFRSRTLTSSGTARLQ